MSDLISRSALIEALNKYVREKFTLADEFEHWLEGMTDALDIIEAQPTAYDAKKVVAELEEEITWAENHGLNENFRKGRISGLRTAIRIVRKGGTNEI